MDEEIYLSDLLAPVFAKWRLVLVVALLGAAIGMCFGLRGPRKYESTATIYVQQSSPMGGLRTNLPISLGSALGGSSTGYYTTVLQSESMLRSTMDRISLLRQPSFTQGKRMSRKEALRELRSSVTVRDNKNGSIVISAKWTSPDLPALVANGILDCLSETVTGNSSKRVHFIGRKLAETTRLLDEAQDRLLDFQKKSGVPVLEEEGKRLMDELSKLDGQLLLLDVDLMEIRSDLGNARDLDTLVEREIKKRGIESSRDYVLKTREATLSQLNGLPDVASKYIRLERDLTVLSKTFELLTQSYELARIEQQGEGGDYQVIDRARPADRPLPRGAGVKTVMGGFVGFLIAAFAVSSAAHSRKRKKMANARNL
jgi:uncharacterized protein involved in exopolysaccharide biosynthesis